MLESSLVARTTSSSGYLGVGGRGNQGIGYKPVTHFVRGSSMNPFSETTPARQARGFVVFSHRSKHIDLHSRFYIDIVRRRHDELLASRASNAPGFCEDPERPWFEVKYSVSAKSNDRCHVGSWGFAPTRVAATRRLPRPRAEVAVMEAIL